VLVHHRAKKDAENNPYVLQTPLALTDLRFQLITPPYSNLNSASTGLGARDQLFCLSDTWSAADRSACTLRAQGSRATLGYSGITELEVRAACKAHYPGRDCGQLEDVSRRGYLAGGQPTVIIDRVTVNGLNRDVLTPTYVVANTVCAYETVGTPGGTVDPLNADGSARRVYFGDPSKEQSNQKRAFYATVPASPVPLLDFMGHSSKTWALLNCNYTDVRGATPKQAELVLSFPPNYVTSGSGAISEDANGCRVASTPGTGTTTYTPCYEAVGSRLDYLSMEEQLNSTLELTEFTSFGWDEERPR
jgi:hypothetical protein